MLLKPRSNVKIYSWVRKLLAQALTSGPPRSVSHPIPLWSELLYFCHRSTSLIFLAIYFLSLKAAQPKWIMFGLNALVTAFSYGFLLLISAWFWGDADGVQLRDHKLFDHYWSSEASDILRSGPHAQKLSQGSSSFDGENEARQPWYARLFPSTLKRATPPVRYAEDEYYPLEEGAPRSKSFEAGYPTFSDTANKKRSTNSFENVVAPPIFPVPHTETLGRLEWNDAVQNLNGHSAPVKTLQYSADGRYLAVASWDCVAAIHAVREGGRFSTYCVLEAADALGLIDKLAWWVVPTLSVQLNELIVGM